MNIDSLVKALNTFEISEDEKTVYETRFEHFEENKRSDIVIDSALIVEEITEYIFKERNVPDDLFEAYSDSFTKSSVSLYEKFLEVLEKENPRSTAGLISNIKGKVFELRSIEEMAGEVDLTLAENPNQPIWDFLSKDVNGVVDYYQAKIGGESYFSKVAERIQENPDLKYILGDELYEKAIKRFPDLKEQFIKVDISNEELTSEVTDKLHILIGNMGLDIPDEIGELLPYIGEIVLGLKLLLDLAKNKKELKYATQSMSNRMALVRTIACISKFGVKTLVGWACGVAGGLAGGPYAVFTATISSVGGIIVASMIIKKLEPRFIEIIKEALKIDENDLYYYQNKLIIDKIGFNLYMTKV